MPKNITGKQDQATNNRLIQRKKCNDNFGLQRLRGIFVAKYTTNEFFHTSTRSLAPFYLAH